MFRSGLQHTSTVADAALCMQHRMSFLPPCLFNRQHTVSIPVQAAEHAVHLFHTWRCASADRLCAPTPSAMHLVQVLGAKLTNHRSHTNGVEMAKMAEVLHVVKNLLRHGCRHLAMPGTKRVWISLVKPA